MQTTLEMDFSIAEHAADSVLITDTESRVIYQNPEARRVFGLRDDELLGQSVLKAIHHHYPDGRPVPLEECEVYRAAVLEESTRDFTWVLYRKDGSQFYASCTCSPLYFQGERIGAIFFATDITARRDAEDALHRTNEKLQLAIEAAEMGMFDYCLESNTVIWSDKMKEHFGLPADAAVTPAAFYAGLHPEDRERIRNIINETSRDDPGGHYQYEYRTIGLTDRKERWVSERGRTYFNAEGVPVRRIGAAIDITERRHAEMQLQEAAQHDSLTGLPNRALLFEYCEHIFAQAKRTGSNSAVLFVDLDRFKPINDLYGHEVGDKVLQEVARRLLKCTRKEDIVTRLGGDEFVVVLPRVHSKEDPETVAEHILESIGMPIYIDSLQLTVSPSIGISIFQKHGKDLTSLIRCADLAMYAAKRSGRNTFKLYTPEHQQLASDRLRLERHLKEALEGNQLTLLYQPMINVSSGQLTGVEAFIRLPTENGALLDPEHFIPIAESTGLIDQLGHWVVREACGQHQRWRKAGLPAISMAVNVSASQFRHPDFASQLTQVLDESGMDPHCLQIEITESTVMDNIPDTITKLAALKSRGVRIALDDFGTGYSSLSRLGSLPLDKLKIDRSFTDKLESDESSQSITDTIIGLGRTLKLEVVGEGIESEEAMDYLRDHGCDHAQGYLFSKPLPASDFEAWYRLRLAQYH